jgi:hypothetical protein
MNQVLGSLQSYLISQVLEAGKSKMKASANMVPGDGLLSGPLMVEAVE